LFLRVLDKVNLVVCNEDPLTRYGIAAYASLFLSTLPHTSLDAGTWVWSWVISELA